MQKEYFGFGSINNLRQILETEGARDIFLITGKNSFELCGAKNFLDKLEYNFKRFSDFSPNPQLRDVERGFELFNQGCYDLIVGVGGGSAIDVAKAIKLFDYENSGNKIPLVAIPTTAGSGSEATSFIVYYIGKEKQSKGNPDVTLPDYSICDSQFTMSLSKEITASTGMDALSQAIESYWCINSTEESKGFAHESLEILLENLERAVNSPSENSKEKVMKSANLAGKAINITKTTACHSISYPITSYFNIPHGHAVGLTLGEMLVYNAGVCSNDCLDERGIRYVKENIGEILKKFKVLTTEQARDKINRLMKNIGLETRLSELGLCLRDVELIAEKGFNPDRVKNNPRELTKDNLKKILREIY